jgi:hypothetical protein
MTFLVSFVEAMAFFIPLNFLRHIPFCGAAAISKCVPTTILLTTYRN